MLGLLGAPSLALGAASLTIAPITWNIVGLDSNNVTVGPNDFPVGARVCNTGDAGATNVTSAFVWDSADPFLALRPGTLSVFSGADAVPVLAPSACHDFYYEVEVTRNALAYNHTRSYHVSATADTLGVVTTPVPRQLFVEHLVSQARNDVADVKLNGTSVPNGGTMALVVGETYTIELIGSTATNGYEQLASFINFPNTIFEVLSVATTYTADSSAFVSSPNDKLYGDACRWENDPNSPYYRSCLDVGKVGGGVTVTYQVKILQVPGAPLVNPQPLGTLLYDFSGSSFHYNSDFGVSGRVAAIVDPTTLTLAKSFTPSPISVNGVSALTFTLTNPNPVAVSGLSFSDVFPTTPGAMVVANPPGPTTNGCGSPVFAPVAGAASVSFSGGTIAAQGICTVKVNVTAPIAGSYANTTTHLFAGATDTGSSASATLTVTAAPPSPPATCGLPLAQWNFPTGFSLTSPAPYAPNTTVTASASPGAGLHSIESPQNHTVTPAGTASWGSNGGFDSTGALDTTFNDYFELAVDTTGLTSVDLSFWARFPNGNAPLQILVYSGTSPTPPGALAATLGNPPGTTFPSMANSWESSGTISFASGLNPSGPTYFRIYGAHAKNNNPGSDLYLDDITFTGCGTPQPPTVSKSFSPNPVAVGGSSTLTFTITNPNPTVPLSGIALNDALPAGLMVASGSSAQCGGTLTTTAPSTLSLSGGALAAGASCTVTVAVTATTAGPHDNVSGAVSATESGANSGASGIATASLIAVLPPSLAKQFAPNPVLAGGVSTLTFTITNPNPNNPLAGVSFSDTPPTSPGAMVVAATPAAATAGCGSPSFAPMAGDGALSFSGGTIAAGGVCTVAVNVTAPVAGSYANTSSVVHFVINSATVDGNSASDTLTATAPNPKIALLKQVGPTASGPWSSFLAVAVGGNVFYRFTIENVGDVPLTAVGLNDPLVNTASCSWPSPLPVASPTQDPTATCVVGPVTAAAGSHPNTATASATFGGTPLTASSTATYATTALTIAKSATETSYSAAGDVLHYSFLVTNSGFAPLLGPVVVADDKATDESCPAVSTAGDLDDFLDPGESVTCTATYTVVAGDVTAGSVTNQATAGAGGATSNTATKTVTGPAGTAPQVSATKSSAFNLQVDDLDGSGTLTPGDTLRYTVQIGNTGTADALNAVFTDTPDSNTTLVAGSVTTTQGSVTTGNAPGATQVSVALGTLVASAPPVVVAFTVRINNPFPSGVTQVVNQGLVSGSNFAQIVTDDPATTPAGDPTVDDVVTAAAAPAIPTLSDWGLGLLILALAMAATLQLRRKGAPAP
jgi:uncharacterized repeat protein (TIGR01451 family)